MEKDRKFILTLAAIALGVVALIIGPSAYQNYADRQEAIKKINQHDLPQLDSNVSADESLVLIHTTAGDIKVKLFNKYAPLAVENFITHAKYGYYNGTIFHRVIEDFMIQGGDPLGDGTGGQSIWNGVDDSIDSGDGFANEISPKLYNIRGALSMANRGADTNGSGFFIVQNNKDVSAGIDAATTPSKIIDAYKNGGAPQLDGSYTVFGQVIEGMEVVDAIATAEKKPVDPEVVAQGGDDTPSAPVNPVSITYIEVLQEAQPTVTN